MANFLEKIMTGAKQYSVFDFGMLKCALLFAGILLGTYFWEFFSQYLRIVWILAIVCYIYIIYSTLTKAFSKKTKDKLKKKRK